ncbi:zinc finger, SWIM-type containing protein, partial [Tanacetum coccineum]
FAKKTYVNQLNETKLVDVRVLDAAIQFYYKNFKRKRVVRWLRLEMVQECDNVAEYKVFCSLENGSVECTCSHFLCYGFLCRRVLCVLKNRDIEVISKKVHFESLEKHYNTNCVKKKHKEIWREVEVQVPKPPSWTSKNVTEDIDVVEQDTNAS